MRATIFTIVLAILMACNKPSLPKAILSSFPPSGDTAVFFEFNASQSHDTKTYPIALKFRWNFDGDQNWDTEFSTEPIIVKQFPTAGIRHISVEVMNLEGLTSVAMDSILVINLKYDSGYLTDPRDGQTYSTVNIGGRWWMADCLSYGAEIDPLDKKMSDNGVTERIVVYDCHDSDHLSVYSWYEAIDYDLVRAQGICPDGWHIPTQKEWQALYSGFPMLYIAQQLGKNGATGMNLENGALVTIDQASQSIWCEPTISSFWTSDHKYNISNVLYASHLNFNATNIIIGFLDQWQLAGKNQKQVLNSLRCIKNQD